MGLEVNVYADNDMVFSVSFDSGVDASAQSKVTHDLIDNIYGSDMNAWINGKKAAVLKGSDQSGSVGNFMIEMWFEKYANELAIVIASPIN